MANYRHSTEEIELRGRVLKTLHRIQEVPGLNLSLQTGHNEAFSGFPQYLQENTGKVP
jgi:hypothetical protein